MEGAETLAAVRRLCETVYVGSSTAGLILERWSFWHSIRRDDRVVRARSRARGPFKSRDWRKLADAADLKSADPKGLWGFKSPSRYHNLLIINKIYRFAGRLRRDNRQQQIGLASRLEMQPVPTAEDRGRPVLRIIVQVGADPLHRYRCAPA